MESEGNKSTLLLGLTQEESGRRQSEQELGSSHSINAVEGNNVVADSTRDSEEAENERTSRKVPSPVAATLTNLVTPSKRKFSEISANCGSLPTPKTGGSVFTTPSKAGPRSISPREEAAHGAFTTPFTTPSKMG